MRHTKFVVAAIALIGSLWLAAPASALNFLQPAGSPYGTGELETNSVRTGDLNGDGRDDVFTANADYSASVFLANANGSMTQAAGSPISSLPYVLSGALGDFNADGDLDMVLAHNGSVTVRLGNGNGTFGPSASFPTLSNGSDVAVADFNGDGRLDLISLGWSQNNVSVLFGNGDGTFGVPSTFTTGNGPLNVVVADFNGDNNPDFATANEQNAAGVTVMLNNGSGVFTQAPGSPYASPSQARRITSGDFNNDGRADLAVAVRPSQAMPVLYGTGTGSFNSGTTIVPDSQWSNSVASADFNGDGFDDVVLGMSTNLTDPLVQSAPIYMGNNSTTLVESPDGPWAATSPSYPWTVAVGDFNDDGHPDWVSGDQGGRLSVFLNEAPALTPNPSSFNFGDLVVGDTSAPESFAFTNTGVGPVSIPNGAASVVGTNPGDFAIDGDSCEGLTLNSGDTCYVDIVFTPGAIGGRSATLRVSPSGGVTPASVSLAGTGLANPRITITPGDHNFGTVGVFSSGTPQVFEIESSGTTELDISVIHLTGSNANQFSIDSNNCGVTMQPGESCEVTVNFRPNTPGAAVANLTLATNAPNSPQTAILRGNAQFPGVTFTPELVEFGQVPLNDGPSPSQTVTIGTIGVDLEIEGISVYTGDFADFSITSDGCTGQTISPGETCDVEVNFEPGALGERTANLRVEHISGVAMIPVEGEGVANPGFTFTPAAHDFGTRLTDAGPGAAQVFTLTSSGTTEIETGAVSLAGAAADQFQITADNCSNRTLAAQATCEVSVEFGPTTAGEKVAELSVVLEGGLGTATSHLTGSGQDPVPPPDPCEPVAIKKIAYFTPAVKKRSNIPGVRARITTAGPAVIRISSQVIYHLNGKQRRINYKQRQFRVASNSVNYKVAIPKKLRKKLRPRKQVRFVITYASKSTNPECKKFGEKKKRNLTTRLAWTIPNA